jgi:hypothetical protein
VTTLLASIDRFVGVSELHSLNPDPDPRPDQDPNKVFVKTFQYENNFYLKTPYISSPEPSVSGSETFGLNNNKCKISFPLVLLVIACPPDI